MIDEIFFPQPIQPPSRQPSTKQVQEKSSGGESPFAKILENKLPSQGVKFSQHAQERLKARGINLTETDMKKLEGAVDSVAQKGGQDSLVMLGDAAFVVSVKNRTVVTAMDKTQMAGNVFTNIDSAVIF
ncbi:TIGR02530 family flagellar biosynthesis protein [Geotalea toluenoxydans]|uniref:TIGR02530 family flagellar biosynthesis protein n=1 Tax=Geotalea toluenoxydans TaxID=421624 RepID=UPI0006D028B1|nr:TIGR02530 family flagellar biosynthesis protein [Geotalea toluenoxydans]